VVANRREVRLSPDVAFSLRPIPPREIHLDPALDQAATDEIIGINVNGLMYNGGYNRKNMFGLKLDYPAFLPRLIVSLLEQSATEIWLIPHTFAKPGSPESDPEASRLVRAALPAHLQARVRVVVGDYDQHEIKAVIGKCDFFVGSRMHACIAALSQGIPCVGAAYSMKFRGVFESVGMEEWIVDGRDTEGDAAIRKIMDLYAKRNEVRVGLRLRADAARTQLKEVFASLLSRSATHA
jgi:polysaccharide pyruvyl transferase WcaK-like protein